MPDEFGLWCPIEDGPCPYVLTVEDLIDARENPMFCGGCNHTIPTDEEPNSS